MEVRIKRSYKSQMCNPINVEEISGCLWDNISGGRQEKHFGYALYGYIPYERAMELVDCSGMHASYGNNVRIMIPKSRNNEEPYKTGYDHFVGIVGSKPDCRPDGQIACSKRILELVNEKPMKRGELRSKLKLEKYPVKQIAGAIKRLGKEARLVLSGSSYDRNQLIEIGPMARSSN